MKLNYATLIDLAFKAREKSIAGYSGFAIGAALLCSDGSVFSGCNIECSAFSANICAERVAIFKALSESKSSFEAIAIVGGRADDEETTFCTPCGLCRQVIAEFCQDPDFEVIVAKSEEEYNVYSVSQLLPDAFTEELF